MKESIEVLVKPDGTVEIAAVNFKGGACEKATKFLEDALGVDTSKRNRTPDYYAQETVKQGQRT